MRKTKRKSRENGQAMLEFVLVLPIFLILIFMIIDFGWLMYNYVSVENSARNAARVACVDYKEVNFVGGNGDPSDDSAIPVAQKTYYCKPEAMADYSESEQRLVSEVKNSITSSTVSVESIVVTYTADKKLEEDGDDNTQPDFENRPNGDVIVKVNCKIPVFTPILGAYSDHMKMKVSSSSTYYVENLNGLNDVDNNDD